MPEADHEPLEEEHAEEHEEEHAEEHAEEHEEEHEEEHAQKDADYADEIVQDAERAANFGAQVEGDPNTDQDLVLEDELAQVKQEPHSVKESSAGDAYSVDAAAEELGPESGSASDAGSVANVEVDGPEDEDISTAPSPKASPPGRTPASRLGAARAGGASAAARRTGLTPAASAARSGVRGTTTAASGAAARRPAASTTASTPAARAAAARAGTLPAARTGAAAARTASAATRPGATATARAGVAAATRPAPSRAGSTTSAATRPGITEHAGSSTTPTRPSSSMSTRSTVTPSRMGTGPTRPGVARSSTVSPRSTGTTPAARTPTTAAARSAATRPSASSTPSPAARSASRLGVAARPPTGARSPPSPGTRAGSTSPATRPGVSARSPGAAARAGAPAARSAAAPTAAAAKTKQLQTELEAVLAERDSLQDKVDALQAQVDERQTQLDSRETEMARVAEALEAAKADVSDAHTKFEVEHNDRLTQLAQLQEDLEQAQNESFGLRQQVDQLKDQMVTSEKAIEEVRFEKDEEMQRVRQLAADRSKADEDLEGVVLELEAERERRETLERQAEAAAREAGRRIEELEQECAVGQRDAEGRYRDTVEKHAAELAERTAELEQLKSQLHTTQTELDEHISQLQDLQAAHAQLEGDLAQANDTLAKQRAEIHAQPGKLALAVKEAEEALRKDHKAASGSAAESHQKALQDAHSNHATQLAELNDKLDREREEHEAVLDSVRLNAGGDHARELRGLKQQMAETVSQLRSTHEEELKRLKEQMGHDYERAATGAEAQKKRLELELEAMSRHLSDTRAKWREAVQQLESVETSSERGVANTREAELDVALPTEDEHQDGETVDGDDPPDWSRTEETTLQTTSSAPSKPSGAAEGSKSPAALSKAVRQLQGENQRLHLKLEEALAEAESVPGLRAALKDAESARAAEVEAHERDRTALEETKDRLAQAQKETQENRTVIEELAGAQQQASRAQAQAESVRADLDTRLTQAREEAKSARRALTDAQAETEQLRSDLSLAHDQRQILEEALTATQASVRAEVTAAATASAAQDAEQGFREAQQKLGRTHAELERVQNALRKVQSERDGAISRSKLQSEEVQSLEARLEQAEKEREEAKATLASVETALATTQESQSALHKQLSEAGDQTRRAQQARERVGGSAKDVQVTVASPAPHEAPETAMVDDSSDETGKVAPRALDDFGSDPGLAEGDPGLAEGEISPKDTTSESALQKLPETWDQAAAEAQLVALQAEVERLSTALEESEVDRSALQQSLEAAERKALEAEQLHQELTQASEAAAAAAAQQGAAQTRRAAALRDTQRELRDSQAAFRESQNAFAEQFDLLKQQQDKLIQEELEKADRRRVEELAGVQQAWADRCEGLQEQVTKESEQAASARKRLHEAQRSRDEMQTRLKQLSQELGELKSELLQAREAAANQDVLQSLLAGPKRTAPSSKDECNGQARGREPDSPASWAALDQEDLLTLHAAHQHKVESLVRDHQRMVRSLRAQLAAMGNAPAPVEPSSPSLLSSQPNDASAQAKADKPGDAGSPPPVPAKSGENHSTHEGEGPVPFATESPSEDRQDSSPSSPVVQAKEHPASVDEARQEQNAADRHAGFPSRDDPEPEAV